MSRIFLSVLSIQMNASFFEFSHRVSVTSLQPKKRSLLPRKMEDSCAEFMKKSMDACICTPSAVYMLRIHTKNESVMDSACRVQQSLDLFFQDLTRNLN